MTTEMGLALSKVAELHRRGFLRMTAVVAASRLVQRHGFGRDHADVIADAAASLIY